VIDSADYWTTNNYALGTSGNTSWYAISGPVTAANRITCSGNVNIILEDNCNLTASGGIAVNSGNSLTVYGQSNNAGMLTSTAGSTSNAGIGADSGNDAGTITLSGGVISSTGNGGAGVGGVSNKSAGTMIINGNVKLSSTGVPNFSAGIGSGHACTGGGSIFIGGYSCVSATCDSQGGPAIGLQNDPPNYQTIVSVHIDGYAKVCAKGQTCGIGAGYKGTSSVIIGGHSEVYASGNVGIGSGNYGKGNVLIEDNAKVVCENRSGSYAAIGVGNVTTQTFDIVINGGYVLANNASGGIAIGGPSSNTKVIINGGNVIPMRNGKLDFTAISPAPVRGDASVAASARPKAERKRKRYVA
jgi:hypothetical protein